jgi:hypothetical protein
LTAVSFYCPEPSPTPAAQANFGNVLTEFHRHWMSAGEIGAGD